MGNIRQVLELFLNGQRVDLSDNGGIFLNYKQKEYQNPTIVKNSFSKTLTIPGTDINNQIFNNIWHLTRTQTSALVPYFNQSKRCNFDLFMNGELIEQGYCKLDNIQRNGAEITYQLTLYGGLGDFFYSLSYDTTNGIKRTLASLDYGQDLTFNINKETVKQSWDDLSNGLYPPITFAPAYNGIPEVLDAGKVLINTSGFNGTIRVNTGNSWTEQTGFPSSSDGYSTLNGYGFGECGRELTEWQTRDLRSYLQRPVIHIPFLFNAICNPDNNGGYEVELDPDFFNTGNSYYQDAYLTLPMISELNNNKTETTETIEGSIDGSVGDSTGETNIMVSLDGKWDKYTLTIDLIASTDETTANELYTSLRVYGQSVGYIWGGFGMQLIGLDANRNQVAGSNVWWITSEVDGMHKNLNEMTNGITMDSFKYSTDVSNSIGRFEKSGSFYKWSDTGLTFTMESNVSIDRYRIKIIPGNSIGNDIDTRRIYLGRVWSANTSTQAIQGYTLGFNALFGSAQGGTSSEVISYSDTEVTQASLLSTDNTPADYLISYCKLFNLYFDKDVFRKKIHIYCQKNFYNGAIDLTDDIDDKLDIKPLSFDHKWYSFKYPNGGGKLFADYKTKYGTEYGQQRVNTGYEFDSETEELLENNVYANAVECLEANKYYVKNSVNNVELPSFLTENVTYKLFNSSMDTTEMEIGTSRNADQDPINPKSVAGIFYDGFDKVQFHNEGKPIDGANVLLFYNGTQSTVPTYWLSDDVGYMFQVNDKPTWLYTSNEYDAGGNKIAIRTDKLPQFSRYLSDTSYIYASWDFGRVKELYIPEISYLDGSTTLYERYWQAYIQDLYDVDTRVVTAYIRFEEKPTKESLRHFYYFENSYWVIQDIIDYNPTSYDLTKVIFVKVNDTNNYLNGNIIPPVPEPKVVRIAFTSISWVNDVPYGGGTADKNNCSYTVTAYYSDGSNEDITSQATITGSQEVAETSDTNRHTAGTLTLVASYEDFSTSTSVTIYQQGAPQYVITSITLDNLTWVTDVPAGGGTASYNNCSYTVTAHYNDGTSENITSLAEMTGQANVPGSTSTERHSVGTLTVWALYGDFSDSDTVTMYQAAANAYVDLTTNPTIDATATSINYSVNASHPVTVKIDSAALPQPSYNTHPAGTSTGTFTIPANQHTYAEYFNVDAYLTDTPTVIDYNNVEQLGVSGPTITGITLDNVSWTTDVPYTGGTASYQNCTYTVTAHYSDNTTQDITSQADMSYSTTLNVPATTATIRQNVGVVNVIATYYDGPNPFTSTVVVTAYQAPAIISTYITYNAAGQLPDANIQVSITVESFTGRTDSATYNMGGTQQSDDGDLDIDIAAAGTTLLSFTVKIEDFLATKPGQLTMQVRYDDYDSGMVEVYNDSTITFTHNFVSEEYLYLDAIFTPTE